MPSPLGQFLFPEPPRRMPHERAVNVLFRSAHLLTSGILLGGHVFDIPPHRLVGFFWATLASGAGLIALELYRSCRFVYLGQGAMVWVKLLLLVGAGYWWDERVALLALAAVVASVGAHMSGRYRHYSLRHGRVLD